MNNSPVLTVVTVCYNAEKNIKKTLESLLRQSSSEFEYLIIDGQSTDGTLDIIDEYMEKFKEKGINVRLLSEPDKGIYDAMNKGIKYAKGQWVEFLNAGTDYCSDNVLYDVCKTLETTNAEVVYGDFIRVPIDERPKVKVDTSDLHMLKKEMSLGHEATFFNRKMHKSFPYNININISADYNAILKMYLSGIKFQHIKIFIENYYEDGFSSQNRVKGAKQCMKIRMYYGIIPNTFLNKLICDSGLCAIKEVLYYNLLPPLLVKIWESLKKSGKKAYRLLFG